MSNPKPFLEPDELYARVKELERVVKVLRGPSTYESLTLVPGQALNNSFYTHTAAVYQEVFDLNTPDAVANAIWLTLPWQTDSATTGSVQLINNVAGGSVAAEIILGAGTFGFADWKWLHGAPRGKIFHPSIQAKRTSGTGNLYFWAPGRCIVAPVGSAAIPVATLTGL